MDTKKIIKTYLNLPIGWHYGEGGPMTEGVVNTSLELLEYANRQLALYEFEPFPGVGGELLLSIHKGGYTLDLTVEPDLSITATLERGKEEIYDYEGLSVDEAKQKISDFKERLTNGL